MHIILQTASQLHAHRLTLYLSSPRLQAFPISKGFRYHAVEELGARDSDHRGPCLVLLSDCEIPPEDFNHHIRSTFLRGYIVRVYWYQHSTSERAACISHLKILLRQHDHSIVSQANHFRHGPSNEETEEAPNPGKANSELHGDFQCSRCPGLEKSIVKSTHISSNDETEEKRKHNVMPVRLQTYPRDLEDKLIDEFPEVDCRPHGFSRSLYAVYIDGIYRYGVTSGSYMYLAPPDRQKLAKDSISRASMKLEEALYVLGFDLHPDMTAIDVGASPGAWTQHLGKHVGHVIAVDPAPLHKHVLQPNVTHLRKLAQDAVEEISQYYREQSGFDLLVCDVNRHPVEASQIVLPLLPYVKNGGLLALTLKFHGRGRDKRHKIEEVKRTFTELLTDMDCIWLLGNSTYERTFVGKKI